MSIKGARVLVDGYNIQMAQGTGIKTYGLTLVKALQSLGADVSILFGRPAPETQNAILDEVLFFDTDEVLVKFLQKPKFRQILGVLSDLTGTVTGSTFRAIPINTKAGVVYNAPVQGSLISTLAGLVGTTEFLNAADCYTRSSAVFRLLGTSAKAALPEKVDVFHATYTIPVTVPGAKKITTIHDLIPLRLPSTTLDNKKLFYKSVKSAIKESEAIITVSEHSKQDILNIFDVDPKKVFVTYQPVNTTPVETSEEKLAAALKLFRLEPKNYILFVGAIEPKKNVGRLIDAFARIDTDMPLVVVGKRGWLWADETGRVDQIFGQEQGSKRVRLLNYVTSADLRNLYAGAFCFCFPSLYEGFGLPPIEAMVHGCPVITSNISSLPEVCGDAALYVNPYDIEDIETKISTLINNPRKRQDLTAKGYEQVKTFDLVNYQQRLSQVYESVL